MKYEAWKNPTPARRLAIKCSLLLLVPFLVLAVLLVLLPVAVWAVCSNALQVVHDLEEDSHVRPTGGAKL